MPDPLHLELGRFLADQSLAGAPEDEIIGGLCERFVSLGMPLRRVNVGIDTLHPLLGGRVYRWRRGAGVERSDLGRDDSSVSDPGWQSSPFHHLYSRGELLYRYRYPSPDGRYPFPILEDLAEMGITDYVACVHKLGEPARIGELDCVFSSWAGDGPGGFDDSHVALLEATTPFLAAAMLSSAVRQIARTLVETYLGRDAGERVLRGAISRGVAERIRAVVWFSDLKGFTSMADTIDPTLVLPLLNEYADPQVSAIHTHGGTVLKFMGDGLLAIFPVGESAADAGERALAAADEAFAALAEVSARRTAEALPATGAYLALHIGEVFYGNIGGADRLDFTVIGPAVNEAARMSAMCRSLGRDILVSQAFADSVPASRGRLLPLGSHHLRGVTRAQALHAVGTAAAPR